MEDLCRPWPTSATTYGSGRGRGLGRDGFGLLTCTMEKRDPEINFSFSLVVHTFLRGHFFIYSLASLVFLFLFFYFCLLLQLTKEKDNKNIGKISCFIDIQHLSIMFVALLCLLAANWPIGSSRQQIVPEAIRMIFY